MRYVVQVGSITTILPSARAALRFIKEQQGSGGDVQITDLDGQKFTIADLRKIVGPVKGPL